MTKHHHTKAYYKKIHSAKPHTPVALQTTTAKSIKIATSNLFVLSDIPPTVEATFSLMFESLVATELSSYLSHDMVKGQNINYQPITNLSGISQQYSPFKIIQLQGTSEQFIRDYEYSLESYLPHVGTATNGDIVYVDLDNNTIVIDFVSMFGDERVEVEFLTYDSLRSDTIYK